MTNLKKFLFVSVSALFALGALPFLVTRAQTLPQFDTSIFEQFNQTIERQFEKELEALLELQKPDVGLEADTQTPLPGAQVRVLAPLPKGGNPGEVMFQWSLDGQTVSEGFGQYQFSFQAKDQVGALTKVAVTAYFTNNPPITREMTFVVADVLLTFNAQTLVPPGYRGRNLPTTNSPVNVSAAAILGVQADPVAMQYQWQHNGRPISRGYGNRTISFLAEGQGNNEITVEITSPAVAIQITKSILIPIVEPQVVLYPEPGSFKAITGKEISAGERGLLFAQPYFFSAKADSLQFSWQFLNQRTIGSGEEFKSLRYAGPPRDQITQLGVTPLQLNVRNPANSAQQAKVVVPMRFK